MFDSCQGQIAATLIGTLTVCVVFIVDVRVVTASGWKEGSASQRLCKLGELFHFEISTGLNRQHRRELHKMVVVDR
jgi:hypothetical protein